MTYKTYGNISVSQRLPQQPRATLLSTHLYIHMTHARHMTYGKAVGNRRIRKSPFKWFAQRLPRLERERERERERNNRAVEAAAAIWPSIRSTLEKRNEIPRANRNTNHGYYELVIYVRGGERGLEWKERKREGRGANGNGDQHLWAA